MHFQQLKHLLRFFFVVLESYKARMLQPCFGIPYIYLFKEDYCSKTKIYLITLCTTLIRPLAYRTPGDETTNPGFLGSS